MRFFPIILGLALTACSPSTPESKTDPVPAALVQTASATQAGAAEIITLYGVADAGQAGQFTLSSPAESVIATINAQVGTSVRKGQIVAVLRPSAGSGLDRVKAASDARTANDALARARRLRADGLMSDADVNSAGASATAANATLASLNSRQGGLTLVAPVSGTVSMVGGSPGTLVAAGAPVAQMQLAGDLRARFGIDPALARRLARGTSIRILPSGALAAFTVPIDGIDRSADPQTRLASLYARLPASAGVGHGESLRGDIKMVGAIAAVTIPYAALLDDGGQPYVFVIEKGIARRRDVVIATEGEDGVALTRGVNPGEQVVTAGGTALEDGMKVRFK